MGVKCYCALSTVNQDLMPITALAGGPSGVTLPMDQVVSLYRGLDRKVAKLRSYSKRSLHPGRLWANGC